MALNFGNDFDGGLPSYVKFLAAPPPPTTTSETLREKEIVAAKKKKMRSLLDIDSNASPQGDFPAAVDASVSGVDNERRRRRWAALLDAAAIAVIREYEGNLEREDMEYRAESRIRNPRKSGGGGGIESWWSGGDRRWDMSSACGNDVAVLVAPPPVHRSKRGRVVALPNRYKDSVLGPAATAADEQAEEEFSRRKKSPPAAIVAADRKSRRLCSSLE